LDERSDSVLGILFRFYAAIKRILIVAGHHVMVVQEEHFQQGFEKLFFPAIDDGGINWLNKV